MPEDEKPEVVKNPGHRFQPGHPRFGGRKKRDPRVVREMADRLHADPIEFCLKLIAAETVHEVRIVDGKKTRVEVPVTVDMKMEACRIVSGYLYPKLTSTKLVGKDDGPVEVATLDIAALLANPDMARMAQNLALAMAEQERLEGGLAQPAALLPAPVEIGPDGYVKK